MILKNLTLKNYRKFKNILIEFPDGITGVLGLNGVGKSTIFEAIAWVLYGSVAARTSTSQIKREGSLPTDPCRVELEFIFEDDNYRIVREMIGKNLIASATATINGKIAATGSEVVSKYIQNKLGMDFKSFFTSIFAKQKELNALSSMNASERRPLILKMLGIDSLDEVIKEIKSDKRNKDSLIEKLNQDLVDEAGKDKIVIYTENINDLEKQKKENLEIIKKLKEKLLNLIKERNVIEKKCKTVKSDFENINKMKENLVEKKTLFERKNKLADEIKNLNDKIENRIKKVKNQKTNLENFKDLDSNIESLNERLNLIKSNIEEYIKQTEQKNTLINKNKEEINELETKKKKIEKIGPEAICPTCERVLADQYNNLITKFEKEKSEKKNDIISFEKDIKSILESKEKIKREEQALLKKDNYYNNQIREKERIETTIKNISNEIDQEKIELISKQKKYNELKELKFDIKEYKNIIEKTNQFYKKYQEVLSTLDNIKETINSFNLDIERKESDKRLITQKIDNFKEKISELKKYEDKIKKEKIIVNNLRILSDVMSNFRTHLISRIRPTLSSYASDFFEQLTDGKYHELELDEDYNLLIYDDGNAYSIERFSGGEEDLANLCLRLAISEVITERAGGVFNFIILDEIFGSQDVFRRHNIIKALSSLSLKFRQIFLITHIEELKNDMENTLIVIEKEDGSSKVKID
ncbi:MAG: AAA family ATPase [Thermoplasmatales archaeon SG8-52-3]|nr:MAG: AAA family ATPase [Thermoplasmatales archaeon SG8-52-3]